MKTKEFKVSVIVNKSYMRDQVTGKVTTEEDISEVEKNNSIQFISDSLVKVYNQTGNPIQINIYKITEISFVKGNLLWRNAWIGAGTGAVLGLVIGGVIEGGRNCPCIGGTGGFTYIISIPAGLLIGGVIGGLIGADTDSYKDYDISKIRGERKSVEIHRIINQHRTQRF